MNDLFSKPEAKRLRPYQVDALDRLKGSILAGNKRVVLVLPTGAGKTLMAATIARGALAKGGKAVFTAPMITLIDQTIEAFEAEGLDDIGAIQADHPRTRAAARVQVASVQTLQRRSMLPSASVVMIDECHVFNQAVTDWMAERPDLVFVGLTATPGRPGMGEEWQDLVVGVTTRELIDMGFLSRFSVYAASDPDMRGVKIVAGDYQAKGAAEAMQSGALVGDIVGNYLMRGDGRPTLGFASTVAHAKRMAEDFEAAGVPSAYVEARTDTLERKALQAAFRRGEIRVIWSVRTMTTGVDLPVSGVIDAAPTRSPMLHQQKIGRGLRVNEGTEDLVIWDHAGNTKRIGFVDDLDWSDFTPAEGKETERERKAPLPKPCPACAYLMPPRIKACPQCGAERKPPSGYVETIDGDLVPLRGEAEQRAGAPLGVRKAWWSQLLLIAQERGRSRGWAAHAYREKFAAWPSRLPDIPAKEAGLEVRSYVKHKDIRFAKAREKKRGVA